MASGLEQQIEELTVCDIDAKRELSERLVIACRIKRLSPAAFQMQVSDVIHLPDEFDLLIPVVQGIDQRCRARMVWRTEDRVGGAFLRPLGQ